MFRSASFFIGTSFTVAVFTIFATSIVDSIVGIPHKIYSMQKNFNPHKKPISLLNVPICTQGMQRTWWPEAGTIIVTGPYCFEVNFLCWPWPVFQGQTGLLKYKHTLVFLGKIDNGGAWFNETKKQKKKTYVQIFAFLACTLRKSWLFCDTIWLSSFHLQC